MPECGGREDCHIKDIRLAGIVNRNNVERMNGEIRDS